MVALGFGAVASLSGPALAEAVPGPTDPCTPWAVRGTQNAVRSVAPTATCRLPSRIARRKAERMAMAAAQPDLVLLPAPPPPSRYVSMLILGVGF